MIHIDELHSEVVLDQTEAEDDTRSPQVRKEELRQLVRELLREELARYLRTEVTLR